MNVLVTGADGMLARALTHALAARSHDVRALGRLELDVSDPLQVIDVIGSERPDVVVQCAAYTRVDDAEAHEASALRINAEGARNVALACDVVGARFVYPSTDYVFAGDAVTPYSPDARIAPLGAYGRTKAAGEAAAREAGDHLIVRTAWLYGHGGRHFLRTVIERARAGLPLRVVDDQHGAPTLTDDLAAMIVALLEADAPAGTYHATNAGHTTWYGFATAALQLAGIDAAVKPVTTAEYGAVRARRPSYSVLDCSTTYAISGPARDWRDALARAIDTGVHETVVHEH